MINIKPLIVKMLKESKVDIYEEYPSDFNKLPCICYTEEENSTYSFTDKEEYSRVSYRIDIWNTTSTSDLALTVDNIMQGRGFKRVFSFDANDDYYKHKVLRYSAIIHNQSLRIFKE